VDFGMMVNRLGYPALKRCFNVGNILMATGGVRFFVVSFLYIFLSVDQSYLNPRSLYLLELAIFYMI